jgi:hypothetical protein
MNIWKLPCVATLMFGILLLTKGVNIDYILFQWLAIAYVGAVVAAIITNNQFKKHNNNFKKVPIRW